MDPSDETFFHETQSQIRELSSGLIALESERGDEASVDELFRVAHSLKGSCRLQGLSEAGDLAHALEDVLGEIRAGRVAPTTPLVDEALDAVDQLEATVEAAANGTESDCDIDATRASLRSTLEEQREQTAPADASTEDRTSGGPDDDLEDIDGLSDDVVAALEETTEFDDVDALLEEADDADEEEVDGWGLLGDDPSPDDPGREETGERAETPDDPSAFFEETKDELDDEEGLDSLEEEIHAIEFSEFEDDDYTIDELIDLDPDEEPPGADEETFDEITDDASAVNPVSSDELVSDDQPSAESSIEVGNSLIEPESGEQGEPAATDADKTTGDGEPVGPATEASPSSPPTDREADRPADDSAVSADGSSVAEVDGPDLLGDSTDASAEAEPEGTDEGDVPEQDAPEQDESEQGILEEEVPEPEEPEQDESEQDESEHDILGQDESEDAENVFIFGDEREDDEPDESAETETEPEPASTPDDGSTESDESAEEIETGEPTAVSDAGPASDPAGETSPSGSDVPDPESVPDVDLDVDLSTEVDAEVADDAGEEPQLDVAVDEEMAEFESQFDELLGEGSGEGAEQSEGPTFQSAVGTIEESRLDADEFPTADDVTKPEGAGEFDRLQTMTVDADTADQLLNVAEELSLTHLRLDEAIGPDTDEDIRAGVANLLSVVTEYRETVMDVRLMPLRTAVETIPRTVRDIAESQDKDVQVVVDDVDVDLDRDIIDRLSDPLVHIARNAVDHGIEPPEDRTAAGKPPEATIEIRAERVGDEVRIEVSDDGRGIDPEEIRQRAVEKGVVSQDEADQLSRTETYDLLFEPGFTTREEVTDVSGRGVGMDVVYQTVADLNGSVHIESEPGEGTTVRLTVPVSVVFTEVLFVEAGGQTFGIPMSVVEQITPAPPVSTVDGREVVRPADLDLVGGLPEELAAEDDYPLVRLRSALDLSEPDARPDSAGQIVWARAETRQLAIRCDSVRASREVIVRPYGEILRDVPGVSGATTLGDGEAVNVLDVESI